MKKINLFLAVAAAGVMMTSCAGETKHEEETTEATEATEEVVAEVANWTINAEKSTVRWEGSVTGGQVYSHFGSISVKEGTMTSEGETMTAGKVAIDMTTIAPEDEGYSEERPAADLVGHLATADFFDIENNPNATFEFTRMEGMSVFGNLNIRGKSNEEELIIDSMEVNEAGELHIVGHLDFDRQKYDVAWKHYMEDVLLSDNINLQFDITGSKS
ncbi:MAG TPA: hypothetical protein DCX14_02140 [Flavobacteriales bacterium]|nr:hypothetical protein [Flavobacteriales bacterium]